MSYSLSQRPIMAPGSRAPTELLEMLDVRHEPAKVIAIVDRRLRETLEAGIESTAALRMDCVPAISHTIRERSIRAILVSAKAHPDDVRSVGRLAMRCAGVPAVAIQDEAHPPTPNELLYLGSCGVKEVVNLSRPDGWRRLRNILADAANELPNRIYGFIDPVLTEASPEIQRFFQFVVWNAPRIATVQELARELGIKPSTFASRFFRARLPLPKCYLAGTRLVYVRALLEAPSASIASVAYELRYSSPQALGRHVRQYLGITAGELRRDHSLATIVALYLSNLIVPFRETLKQFNPLGEQSRFGTAEVFEDGSP